MPIHRTKDPFVLISREISEDFSLSLSAVGLYCRIVSLDPENKGTDSSSFPPEVIKELLDNGHIGIGGEE